MTTIDQTLSNSKETYSILVFELTLKSALEVFTLKSYNNFIMFHIYKNILEGKFLKANPALNNILSSHSLLPKLNVYYMIGNRVVLQTTVPRIHALAGLFSEIATLHNSQISISKNRILPIYQFNKLVSPPANGKSFRIESYHLTLYKYLRFTYDGSDTEIPIIDPVIPYLTKDIASDICQLINIDVFSDISNGVNELQRASVMAIHAEMSTVFQIISTSFCKEVGLYQLDEKDGTWHKVKQTVAA